MIGLAWFVCTIAKSSSTNWEICKVVGGYAVPGRRRRPNVDIGDHLLIWIGGRGYVADCRVTGESKILESEEDAPWPGGPYRYGYVIPMEVLVEPRIPVMLSFVGSYQIETGVSKSQLQRSFALIPEVAGIHVGKVLASHALHEQAADRLDTME